MLFIKIVLFSVLLVVFTSTAICEPQVDPDPDELRPEESRKSLFQTLEEIGHKIQTRNIKQYGIDSTIFEVAVKSPFAQCQKKIISEITCKQCPNITDTNINFRLFVENEAGYMRDMIKQVGKCLEQNNFTDVSANRLFYPADKCVVPIIIKVAQNSELIANVTTDLEQLLNDFPDQINSCIEQDSRTAQLGCFNELMLFESQCYDLAQTIVDRGDLIKRVISDFQPTFRPCLTRTIQEIRKDAMKKFSLDIIKCKKYF